MNRIVFILLFVCGLSYSQQEEILKKQLEYNYEFEISKYKSQMDRIAQIYQTQIDALKKDIDSLYKEIRLLKSINEIQGDAINIMWRDKTYKIRQDSLRDVINHNNFKRKQGQLNVLHQKQ